jgi:DNA mismatch endonuclease, patch repair protein
MRANTGRDTSPERALRSAVHRLGLRFRVNRRPVASLRRTADLVFGPAQVAVFLDGCFWHGCPQHYSAPVRNGAFWAKKVSTNKTRDLETNRLLAEGGWLVLRFWEHEDPHVAAARIAEIVAARRATMRSGRRSAAE